MTNEELSGHIMELNASIAQLTTLVQTEGARCPYREDIRKAANNCVRLDNAEKAIHGLQLDIVRASLAPGAAGGGIVAILGGALIVVGKAAGWL